MIILQLVGIYVVSSLLAYLLHKAFHQKWTGPFYRAHMHHHLKLYPKNDLLDTNYRDAGKNNTVWYFLPFLISLCIGVFLIAPNWIWGSIYVVLLITYAQMNNYLHDQTHVKGSWWERFQWFHKVRKLHFVHHFHMDKNLGIIDFVWDKVFKTLKR